MEKGKGCRSYHSKNEDMANETTENMPTTGQVPAMLLVPVFVFRKQWMEFAPILVLFLVTSFALLPLLEIICHICGQFNPWTLATIWSVPRLCVVPLLVLGA